MILLRFDFFTCNSCSNFPLKFQEASNLADKNVEPFSLWEYPALILGAKKCIFQIDFSECSGNLERIEELVVER